MTHKGLEHNVQYATLQTLTISPFSAFFKLMPDGESHGLMCAIRIFLLNALEVEK